MTEFKPGTGWNSIAVKPPLETKPRPVQPDALHAEPHGQLSQSWPQTANAQNSKTSSAGSALAAAPEKPAEERRGQRRMRVLQRALIVFNSRQTTIECMVRDISDGGCRLKMGAPVVLPERFIVHFCKTRDERAAELVWRTDVELGVRFID